MKNTAAEAKADESGANHGYRVQVKGACVQDVRVVCQKDSAKWKMKCNFFEAFGAGACIQRKNNRSSRMKKGRRIKTGEV